MSDEQDKLKLSLEPPKLFGRKKKPAGSVAAKTSGQPEAASNSETETETETTVIDTATDVDTPPDVTPVPETDPDSEEPADTTPDPDSNDTELDDTELDDTVVITTTEPEKKSRLPRLPTLAKKPAPDGADTAVAAVPAEPLLSLYPAAALTGFVTGAAMVLLTWLSLRGCEAVRGMSSCGGGPGFILLVATFALCVFLGSSLLRAFVIPEPASSSFLAVGLVAVIALLFLIDYLDHWSMVVVVPVLSIGGFLLSVWVTKTFVEPADEG